MSGWKTECRTNDASQFETKDEPKFEPEERTGTRCKINTQPNLR